MTNPFELFVDYGLRIKARSRGILTFVVQLSGGGFYVPTNRAVRGGGYSATVDGNAIVGPEGGQIFVEETVRLVNRMWPGADTR